MTKYCRQCGTLVGAGLAFCTQCGTQVANLDEGPETVVHRPIVISLVDPEPVAHPQPPQPPIVAQPLPPRSGGKTVLLVLSGIIVAICGAAGIAALFYFLGRQAMTINSDVQNTQANTNSNTTNQSPTPANVTPTPKKTPSVQTENVTGNEVCSVTAQTQLHRDCDTKDCDADATTTADAASPGSKVTRLGFYKNSGHSFKWEKVSAGGKELWISSNKIDCGLVKAPTPTNSLPANKPPANNQRTPKSVPQKTPRPSNDPWQGVPADVKAICNDGTYSRTRVGMFQCSFHGGVRARRE